MKKSQVTANYVTRVFNYHPPQPFNWGQCDQATQELFSSTGWQREWSKICTETADLGLKAIEVWLAHLPYHRVDENHIKEFARITHDHGLKVSALAGWVGGPDNSRASFEKACIAAKTIGAPYIQGGMAWDKLDVAQPVLKEYEVKITIENHPGMETAEKMLEQIKQAPDVLGAGPDIGWFGAVNADPVAGVRLLGAHILHVHWKDMAGLGGHASCAMGYGVLDMQGVLNALREIGFSGYLSLEHEPAEGDPTPDVKKGLEWLLARDPTDD